MPGRQRTSIASGSRPRYERHVIFDGRYIQDRYHGIGRYAFNLLRELAILLPGQPFKILRDPSLADSRFDWAMLAAMSNVAVQPMLASPFGAREQLVVAQTLAGTDRAVYHTPYFALPWLLTAPSLVTVHDCIFERDPRYMPHRWAHLYFRLLMFASLSRARAVFVPSAATARDVRRFYGISPGKLIVTPEAAGPKFQPIEDRALLEEVRSKHRLPERFVLAVGARRPHKNFGRLVEAVGKTDGVYLVFVGEADERFSDDAARAAQGLGDRVRFLGRVGEEELPLLYNLATVFACPSLIEGFGLPVLEAMACGLPVVCSAIPVLREVANEAALMVPPTDTQAWSATLQRLMSDAALRESLSRAGRERAESFTWRKTAEAVLPVYNRMGIGRSSPNSGGTADMR